MNTTIEYPSVTAASPESRSAVPRRRIRIVLVGAAIALGAAAGVNFAAGSSNSPPAPITAEPRVELPMAPVEITPGCLNDVECYGRWP